MTARSRLLHRLRVRFSVRENELPQAVSVRCRPAAVQLAELRAELLEGRPGNLTCGGVRRCG